MKNFLSCFVFCLLTSFVLAQPGDKISYGGNSHEVFMKDGNKKPETLGSPYLNDAFVPSRVKGYDQPLNLRFNGYTGDMEFQINDLTYALSKEEFPVVLMGPSNTKYFYTNYTLGNKTASGFLRVLSESDKTSFYVRESVEFIPGTESSDGYSAPKLPTYKRAKDEYFVKIGTNTIEIPSNKKKFAALFPNHEKQILDYISASKLALNKEADLISISKFINGL